MSWELKEIKGYLVDVDTGERLEFQHNPNDIGKNSRYAGSLLIRDADGNTLGTRRRIDTTPRYDDRFHTVIDGDRIDLTAHRYLGDAKLWWIVADYNDLFFPLELETGAVLRIPSVEHVQMRILE